MLKVRTRNEPGLKLALQPRNLQTLIFQDSFQPIDGQLLDFCDCTSYEVSMHSMGPTHRGHRKEEVAMGEC